MLRKIIVQIICTLLLFGMTVTVYGAEMESEFKENLIEEFKYSRSTVVKLEKQGKTAVCLARITGRMGVTTKLTVKCSLQKNKGGIWTTVETWSDSTHQIVLSLRKERKVSGGTYRVHAVFHAYAGDKVER